MYQYKGTYVVSVPGVADGRYKDQPKADTLHPTPAGHHDPMGIENRAHAGRIEIHIVLGKAGDLSDIRSGVNNFRSRIEIHVRGQTTGDALSDSQLCFSGKGDVKVTTVTLFYELSAFIDVPMSLLCKSSTRDCF